MKIAAITSPSITFNNKIFKPSVKNSEDKTQETMTKPSALQSFKSYTPSFSGLWFENNIVKNIKKKEYQGLGLYKEGGGYVDFNKVGWANLSQEPLDLIKANNTEIYAFQHANALAEANDSTWVRRFNHYNVTKPLAVFHTLNSQKAKAGFEANLKELLDIKKHKSLDVPITNQNGRLNLDCVVFDTETTGTNLSDTRRQLDKIIQIGGIQVKGGKVINESAYNQLINPEMHIPEGATKVHGITDDMLQDKPTMEKVLKPFINDYLNKKNGVIVAYNSKFDMTILNNEIKEHNKYSKDTLKERPVIKVLDPFILIQRIHPYLGARKKLGEQYKFLFCKNLDDAHDAFADVKGTVNVLKYCLYYLSEHRVDKSKPLTMREVLVFQNGGNVPNIDIPLDNEGCNARVNFRKSYTQIAMAVDNYFKGYKLTSDVMKELEPLIGSENIQKLNGGLKNKLVGLNQNDGLPENPAETDMTSNDEGLHNAFYVMERNFKKVLDLYKIDAYGDLSKEEVVELITEKAKQYIHDDSIDIWMKNPNPKDIKDGNDMPDFKISKRVMEEEAAEKAQE